jgi:hypothetical protein
MSLQLVVLAVADVAPAGVSWLGPVSLVTVVAMVLLELGKSLQAITRTGSWPIGRPGHS